MGFNLEDSARGAKGAAPTKGSGVGMEIGDMDDAAGTQKAR